MMSPLFVPSMVPFLVLRHCVITLVIVICHSTWTSHMSIGHHILLNHRLVSVLYALSTSWHCVLVATSLLSLVRVSLRTPLFIVNGLGNILSRTADYSTAYNMGICNHRTLIAF